MFEDSPFAHPVSSFPVPVPLLPVEPDDPPLETMCINAQWLAYLRGCAKQLLLQSTWRSVDPEGNYEPSGVELAQKRAFKLLGMMQDEGNACVQVPNWEAYLASGGAVEFFGQRGQGLAGTFYDYAGLVFNPQILFRDKDTHAPVGGTVIYLKVYCVPPSDCSQILVSVTGCIGSPQPYLASCSMDVIAAMGTRYDVKQISILCEQWLYLRMIMKFDWTCGEI